MRCKGDPFDLSTIKMCPEILYSVIDPLHPSLLMIRVFENKYPVLGPIDDSEPMQASHIHYDPAMGRQEVIL